MASGTWELAGSTHLPLFPSGGLVPCLGMSQQAPAPHILRTQQTPKLCLLQGTEVGSQTQQEEVMTTEAPQRFLLPQVHLHTSKRHTGGGGQGRGGARTN